MQLLFDAREQAHAVHPAVRQAVQALVGRLPGGAAVLASSHQRFVLYTAQELGECSRLYATGSSSVIARARAQLPMFVALAERVAAMGDVAGVAGELLPGVFQVIRLSESLGLAHMSCWLAMAQALHAHAPEQHRASAAALHGNAQRFAGHLTDAEALHRQAIEAYELQMRKEHPDTLASINGLAICVYIQGRHADAEALHRQALEARRRVLGEEHPSTLATAKVLKSCQEKLKAA